MKTAKFDSPNEAVFVARFGKNNKPLFGSQVELADAIKALPDEEYESKNLITIRSAVSQIFTGERNLSKNLRRVLFKAIAKRFDKTKYDFDKFEKLLIEKFRSNYDSRLENKRNELGDVDYKNLVEATKTAKQILITTLEPAELHKSELADRLKDELLQKAGVVAKEDPALVPGTYQFYFPKVQDGRIAKEFWLKLRAYAMEQYGLSMEEINERLKQANSKDNRTISTYLVDSNLALYPFVFLDFKSIKIRGFCVSYRDQEPSVGELSYDVVYTWKELIYPLLDVKGEKVIEFTFKDLT